MNGDTVTFRNREALDTVEANEAEPERPYIDPEGFHDAKSVAPGYDVYALYDKWVSGWIDSGRPEQKRPRADLMDLSGNKHKTDPHSKYRLKQQYTNLRGKRALAPLIQTGNPTPRVA